MSNDREGLMLDLLCQKAVYGLSREEEKRLSDLLAEAGPGFDPETFELTAAALSTARLSTEMELPANLRSRIAADAERFFDEKEAAVSRNDVTVPAETDKKRSGFSLPSWLGWAVAAAACIALAFNLYSTRSGGEQRVQQTPPAQPASPPADELRRKIDSAPDLERAAVGPGNVQGVKPSGEVVWSDTEQKGYIRLSGLPVNDTGQETYQIWIIASNQDPKTPVDGGVFDVSSGGEAIIPIDPRVRVANPKAFAITIEKPGGVVVSKQDRVAALTRSET